MIMARRMGAVGYIHLWPSDEDVIHEGIVTPIWGTPTPDNIDTCPEIPVVAVKRKDGLMLKDMASKPLPKSGCLQGRDRLAKTASPRSHHTGQDR